MLKCSNFFIIGKLIDKGQRKKHNFNLKRLEGLRAAAVTSNPCCFLGIRGTPIL
jgi:hypothetical protein